VEALAGSKFEEGTAVSIQFNSNREIRHAVKTMIEAIELWVLAEQFVVPAESPPEPGTDT